MRFCTRCHITKNKELFCKDKSQKDGISKCCKSCQKEKAQKYRKNSIKPKCLDIINNKVCCKCLVEKNKNEFINRIRAIDRLSNRCKKCEYKRRIDRGDNKNQYNIRKLEWEREKYKNDLNHKLKSNFRCRMNNILNQKQLKKTNKSIIYLGCGLEEYKNHLSKQFKGDMTWNNHGILWEVDHIIPLSKFDLSLEENIYKAFNYTNTQPLYKELNRSKGNRV